MHTAALKYIYFLLYYLLLLSFLTLSCQLHLSLFMITGDGGKEYLFEDKHFWKITKLTPDLQLGRGTVEIILWGKKPKELTTTRFPNRSLEIGVRIQEMVYLPAPRLKSWGFLAASLLSPNQTRSRSIDLEVLMLNYFYPCMNAPYVTLKNKTTKKTQKTFIPCCKQQPDLCWLAAASELHVCRSLQISTYCIAVLTKCWKRIQ